MKREEKNRISREKIISSALDEFSSRGYGMSSINTICTAGNISKGVMYHYFRDKDEIYLLCVQECFERLSAHLREYLGADDSDSFQGYFDARFRFFRKYPLYQRLFCDAIISPPQHLAEEIGSIKQDFDALNLSVLKGILAKLELRRDVTEENIIEMFQLFQDFLNARFQMEPYDEFDLARHDRLAGKSLDILLYGVVRRGVKEGEAL